MCGRFVQHLPPQAYAEYYDVDVQATPVPNAPPRYNAAPMQNLLAMRRHPESGRRVLSALRWGLVPKWAKDDKDGARLINARSETVAEKPSFREAWRKKRRCIIPAEGFYEWQSDATGKQGFYISSRSHAPISLAGLWEGWQDPQTSEWVRTFTILTCPANARIVDLHARMPVILAHSDINAFLTEPDPSGLLQPCPSEDLTLWPVSKAVNSVRNDGPELMTPIARTGELPPI